MLTVILTLESLITPFKLNDMECQVNVLFFLDNPETAIIEIGYNEMDSEPDAGDTLWFIYYKRAGLINRFRFIPAVWISRSDNIAEGEILQIRISPRIYIIAIGVDTFNFREKSPQMLALSAELKIKEYIGQLQ